MAESEFPRALTRRERDTLSYLLAVDFPGVEELREQARVASVVGRCRCGCATIELSVDAARARPAASREPVPVEARTHEVAAGGPLELILFVRDGWLDSLEITYYANETPVEFPPLDAFEPPETYSPA
jgi:hypothetical protein